MSTRFTVTEDHLKLLRSADWFSDEGAPAVDPKRPYLGTSSVRSALIELLVPDFNQKTVDELDALDDYLWETHGGTTTALLIAIDTGSFEAGVYEREDGGPWTGPYVPVAARLPEVDASEVMSAAEEAALIDVIDNATDADFVEVARPGSIVLPALTAEATADLEALLDTDLSQDIAAVESEGGRHEVDILHACPSCDRIHLNTFTPDQADTYAGHIAMAASDARANVEASR